MAVVSLLLVGCGDGKKKNVCADEHFEYQDPADTFLLGLDEAWIGLSDAIRRGVTDGEVAGFTAPADGATVSVADWTYEWALAAETRAPVRRPAPGADRDGIGSRIARFLSPEGVAHAHGSPVRDDIYLLEIFLPGEDCTVEVVTTATAWPVDESVRERISAPTTVGARLTWAYEEESIVTEGPVRGPRREVTVEP